MTHISNSAKAAKTAKVLAGLTLAAFVAGCSVAPPGADIHDPYEAANREVHALNKQIDNALFRNRSGAPRNVPEEIAVPVTNFAANTGLPSAIINGILQGDVDGVATNTFRFILNTTIGIGGLFDPAGAIGLHEEEADFGETLHVWGVPEGAYLELPVLGPSTERDAAGEVVDRFLDPLGALAGPDIATAATVADVGDVVIFRYQFSDTVEELLYESADSYAQSRLFYLQNRRFELGMEPPGTNIDGTGGIDPFALDLEGFE